MGFTCKAGWRELQAYRAAKANQWLWREPELRRLHVWYETKGYTDASGAQFYVGLGDMSNNAPGETRVCYPITAPKKSGEFKFRNPSDAARVRALLSIESDAPKWMGIWREKAEKAIECYESVAAPLGSAAWL